MLIVFCETCGFRVQEEEVNSGKAVQVAENRFTCAKCSSAAIATAAATAALNASPRRSSTSGIPTLPRKTPDGGARPPTGGTAIINRPKSTVIRAATSVQEASENDAVPRVVRKPLPLIPIVGAATIVLVVVAMVIALNATNEPPPVAKADAPKPTETPKTPPAPVASHVEEKQAPPPAERPEERMRRAMEETARLSGKQESAVASTAPATQPPAATSGNLGMLAPVDPLSDTAFNDRAARLLKEVQDWSAKNPSDPWTYKEKLEAFANSYRSAPASQDARKLIAEIKIPDTERPIDRMNWHKDWTITPGATQLNFYEEFDGRRFVYQSHPVAPGVPTVTSRTFVVPNDRPFFELRMRGHEAGDHRFVVAVSGVELMSEIVGGKEWRNFTFDLSPLKGKSVEIALIHHNTDWACEFAYIQSPRFVDKAASDAKMFTWEEKNTAAVAAKNAPAGTDAAQEKGVPAAATAPVAAANPEADYAAASDEAFGVLAKGNIRAAREQMEKLAADSRFAALKPKLDIDLAFVKMAEANQRAIVKGAQALSDGRPFVFQQTNGKNLTVGRGTKNIVKEATDSMLTIEQDFGGGKALTRVGIEQLTPPTRFELMRAGLQNEPEGEVQTALAALLYVRSGQGELPPRTIRMMLDAAKKKPANAKVAERLSERFESGSKEIAAEQVFHKAEQAAAAHKLDDAKTLLETLEKEHSSSAFFARNRAAVTKLSADVAKALFPNEKGIMFEYYRAEGGERFKELKLRRPETKLSFDWSDKEPAPGVDPDFAIKARGFLHAEKGGHYGFAVVADDYCGLFIDGKKILEATTGRDAEGEIDLTPGEHTIQFEFQDTGGPAALHIRWRMVGGFDLQDIPEAALSHDPKLK